MSLVGAFALLGTFGISIIGIIKNFNLLGRYMKKHHYDLLFIFLTFVIAMSAILQYVSIDKQTNAIEGSYLPQIFYSDGKCPEIIFTNSSYTVTLNFGNFGRIPATDFHMASRGENIDILGRQINNEIENSELTGILLPIESKENKETPIRYEFKIDRKSVV